MNVQQAMHEAWEASYGFEHSPFDHDQRNEGMYYVKESNGTYYFEPVALQNTSNPISSCHYLGTFSSSKIQNSVALLHTHPYSHQDTITDQRCLDHNDWDVAVEGGYPTYNALNVSSGDKNTVQGTGLKMYVIDKDKIRQIIPQNPSQYNADWDRCGY